MVLLSDDMLSYLAWRERGFSVLHDHFRPSLWFSCGLGSRTPCCLDVSFLIPILARQTLPLCLGFALLCCRLRDCLLNCLCGDGAATSCVAVFGSHFYWAVVSACVMSRVGSFVPAPSSCALAPLYMLGVGRVFPLTNVLLTDRQGKYGRQEKALVSCIEKKNIILSFNFSIG